MSERKKSFFSFSILPPWPNFIFTAIISIYQLINPINMRGFRTWNTQRRAVLRTNQKSFPQMTLPIFLTVTHFFHSKILIWKVFFFKKSCPVRVALNRPGFEKSLYLRTCVSENLVVVQKYFITSTLLYAWDSSTVYAIFFVWHLIFIMFWSKQTKKVSFTR